MEPRFSKRQQNVMLVILAIVVLIIAWFFVMAFLDDDDVSSFSAVAPRPDSSMTRADRGATRSGKLAGKLGSFDTTQTIVQGPIHSSNAIMSIRTPLPTTATTAQPPPPVVPDIPVVPPEAASTPGIASTNQPKQTIVSKPPRSASAAADAATTPSSGGNQSIASIALAQVGKAYRSGATGPNAFDCSGLVYWVFNQAGVHVPRLTSDGYYARGAKISRGEMVPGDLVVYPGHIAIFVGQGQIVAASTPRGGVKHYGVDAPGRPSGFVRMS